MDRLTVDNVFTHTIVNDTKEKVRFIIVTGQLQTKELLSMLRKEMELKQHYKQLSIEQQELISLLKKQLGTQIT